jgi:ComEC/Rec2-related protein
MNIWKRRIAFLRSEYPLIFLTLGVLCGEFIAIFFGFSFVFAVLILLFILPRSLKILPATILIGYLAVYLNQSKTIELPKKLLGKVTGEVRFSVPRQLNLPVTWINDNLETNEKFWCSTAYTPWNNGALLQKGSIFVAKAKITIFPFKLDPLSYNGYLKREGYYGTCRLTHVSIISKPSNGSSSAIEQSIKKNIQDLDLAGLALAIGFGYRDRISSYTEEAFRRVGLAHILVFSGFHLTVVSIWVRSITIYLGVRVPLLLATGLLPQITIWISFLTSLSVMYLVSWDLPAIRAALATLIVFLSDTIRRRADFLTTTFLAFLILILIWPGCFLDIGFQLTFSALTGIGLASSKDYKYLKIIAWTTITTTIVVVARFDNYSLLSPVVNFLFVGVTSVVFMPTIYIAIVTNMSGIDPNGYIIKGVEKLLGLFRDLIWYFSNLSICNRTPQVVEKIFIITLFCLLIIFKLKNLLKNYWSTRGLE